MSCFLKQLYITTFTMCWKGVQKGGVLNSFWAKNSHMYFIVMYNWLESVNEFKKVQRIRNRYYENVLLFIEI